MSVHLFESLSCVKLGPSCAILYQVSYKSCVGIDAFNEAKMNFPKQAVVGQATLFGLSHCAWLGHGYVFCVH